MTCPKCKSENVVVQQVQVGSRSKTKTKAYSNSMGCLWWICVGWWWVPLKKMCRLFIDLLLIFPMFFRRKRRIGESVGKTTTKMKNKTMATCQNCGHSWEV